MKPGLWRHQHIRRRFGHIDSPAVGDLAAPVVQMLESRNGRLVAKGHSRFARAFESFHGDASQKLYPDWRGKIGDTASWSGGWTTEFYPCPHSASSYAEPRPANGPKPATRYLDYAAKGDMTFAECPGCALPAARQCGSAVQAACGPLASDDEDDRPTDLAFTTLVTYLPAGCRTSPLPRRGHGGRDLVGLL